jgi:hypothetical protein
MLKTLMIALLCTVAQAQSTKAPPKPFVMPDLRAYVFSPLLAKDEGCAKDLVKASHLEGLELRKYLAELLTYGCVVQLDGVYEARVIGMRQFVDGTQKVGMKHVALLGFGEKRLTEPIREGWVSAKAVISQAQLEKEVEAKREELKAAEKK